ncbi:transcription factor bHLH68-like isoform X2 [Euphorbia lathyris]|uniref:transcription factor bHLH68-like isoform X2 n=1 Tax=Euphorbia lathyris TaxID=212925 RepID=UPI0033144627
MMAGNPSRWSMLPPSPFLPPSSSSSSPSLFPSQYVLGSSSSSSSTLPLPEHLELPHQSWSQLLMGGFPVGEDQDQEEEDRYGMSHFQQIKKLGNWEEQIMNLNPPYSSNLEGHGDDNNHSNYEWSHHHHHQQVMPHVSSPRSCVTSLSSNSNMLDFSYTNTTTNPDASNHQTDQSSECKSTATGGSACKKARVQPSSSQPPLKVRKEKLGDRITALHQLVSPFGKTDTASVLLEAIGYIRFLQGQIEALSSPYLTTPSSHMRNQISVAGERNSVFPEDPGQDSQDNNNNNKPNDLRSRGLCLVRLSCTEHVGSNNGADFWAPAIGGGGGF